METSDYNFYFKKKQFNENKRKLILWLKDLYDYQTLKEVKGEEQLLNETFEEFLSIDFSTAKPEYDERLGMLGPLFHMDLFLKIPEKYRNSSIKESRISCDFDAWWSEKYIKVVFSVNSREESNLFETDGMLNLFSSFCQLLNTEIGFLGLANSDYEGIIIWLKGKQLKKEMSISEENILNLLQ